MEKKLEIKDTQFRTVPEEEGQADNRKDTSLVDEGPVAEPAADRWNLWIYIYYALAVWGDRVHEFVVFLLVARSFTNSVILAALIGIATLLMPLLLSGPISAAIDRFPRFPLLAVGTTILKLIMMAVYLVLGLLYHFCRQEGKDEKLKFTDPICLISGLGLILLVAVHSFSYLLVNTGFTKDWLAVIKSVIKENGGDMLRLEVWLKRTNVFSRIIAPPAYAGLLELIKLFRNKIPYVPADVGVYEISLALLIVYTFFSLATEILLLRKISNLYPELRDNSTIPVMPSDPNENKNEVINVDEEEPDTLLGQILYPWKIFGRQRIIIATVGFALFFGSVLVPGPVLVTYLAWVNQGTEFAMGDVEISIFHGLCTLTGIFGARLLPHLVKCCGFKAVSLIAVWSVPLLLGAVVAKMFLFEWKAVAFHFMHWVMLGPLLLSRAPIWAIDLVETEIMKNFVSKNDFSTVKGIQWMMSNSMQVLAYVITLMSVYTKRFQILAIISVTFVFVGSILYSVWVGIYGKSVAINQVKVEKDSAKDEREEKYLEEGDLDMDAKLDESTTSSEETV